MNTYPCYDAEVVWCKGVAARRTDMHCYKMVDPVDYPAVACLGIDGVSASGTTYASDCDGSVDEVPSVVNASGRDESKA